ncbi:MAG: plasmid replication protein, CyRepA1 family, partial [Planktothrix sp.]|uniref:plasmid replication protein, CyRepA1 family n=1 Tax=Planktothrix sp. TaxID=3088171 RepID=UPI0038D370F6
PKVATSIFQLSVSWRIGLKIALKNEGRGTRDEGQTENSQVYLKRLQHHWQLPFTPSPAHLLKGYDSLLDSLLSEEDIGFWDWVLENNIPITICEGAKKAGALLTAGYVAISLPGITGGVRVQRDSNGEKINSFLLPELERFAKVEGRGTRDEGRRIYICFDHDQKRTTRIAVNREIQKLGQCFQGRGARGEGRGENDFPPSSVWVVSLPGPDKGVDDFIVNQGEYQFDQLFAEATDLDYWIYRKDYEITYPATKLNSRYLKLNFPEQGLVCIKSGKGTGKTENLIPLIQESMDIGRKVLVISHRIQLGRSICNRLGLVWVEDKQERQEDSIFGFGLCIDSLHPLSQAKFNPSEWEDAIIILDETEQIIWHLLNSSTCIDKRAILCRMFTDLIQTVLSSGGLIIAQDADLSDYAIDYLINCAGFKINPQVYINEYKHSQQRKVIVYNQSNPSHLITQLYELVEGRGIQEEICPSSLVPRPSSLVPRPSSLVPRPSILIVLDSQKVKGKFSCINIESQLQESFPELKILRIDSETVADETHAAFGCMEDINNRIKDYDIIITSPTIGTGVSIDLVNHFQAIFAIFQGAINVKDACQFLARVRDLNVPCHVWASSYGCGQIGNRSSNWKSLLATKNKVFKRNLQILQQIDLDLSIDFDEQLTPEHTKVWAKFAARVNAGLWQFRKTLVRELEAEGHKIEVSEIEKTSLECEQLLAEVFTLDPLAQVPEVSEQLKGTVEKLHHLEQSAKNYLEQATKTRNINQYNYALFIASQALLTQEQYEELKSKRKKTKDELAQQRYYEIYQRYGVEVTPELVLTDMDGYYPKLRLHYYLLYPELVHQRDKRYLERQLETGEGKVCLQDIKLLSAQVQVLKLLGIDSLLELDREFTSESEEILEFADKVVRFSRDVGDYLGISPNTKASPIRIVQDVLRNKIGLPLKCVRQIKLPDGSRQRVYAFDCPTWRYSIFDQWYMRDEERGAREGTPQSIISNIEAVVSDVPEQKPAGEPPELLKRFWTQFWNLLTRTDWKPRLIKL